MTGEKMNDYIIEKLLILSCNIDDFNPQNYEYISQKLFEHKALDVWLTPIYMKKSRSANTLSVLIYILGILLSVFPLSEEVKIAGTEKTGVFAVVQDSHHCPGRP